METIWTKEEREEWVNKFCDGEQVESKFNAGIHLWFQMFIVGS